MGQWASHLYGTDIPFTVPMHNFSLYLYANFTNKYISIFSFLPHYYLTRAVTLTWVTEFRKAYEGRNLITSSASIPESLWFSFPVSGGARAFSQQCLSLREILQRTILQFPSRLIFSWNQTLLPQQFFSITLIQSIVPGWQWHMSHALIYKLLYGTRSRL